MIDWRWGQPGIEVRSPSFPRRSRVAYYGVFDGHAGPRASKFTAEHLHKNIIAKFPEGESKLHQLYIHLVFV